MTGAVASIIEAWGELRVNKGRVLLSLLGVAFSVFALTTVMSGGTMMQQALQQSFETFGGRAAVVSVTSAGGAADVEAADADVLETFDQLGITQRSRDIQGGLRLQTHSGVVDAEARAVDPAWGPMHRVDMIHGRWFADSDQDRLAPAIVVDARLYEQMGSPALGADTIDVVGTGGTTAPAVVIGVIPYDATSGMAPTAYTTVGALESLPAGAGLEHGTSTYLAWVPPEQADAVVDELTNRLEESPTGPYEAYRSDFADQAQAFRYFRWALMAVAVVILLLGALGLVNIALVTIRYRVREIGIRRSYGATGMRIFFGVLMESVVGTVVAGLVGVTAAVALVKAPFVANLFHAMGLVDVPPFPVASVIVGLLAATFVGVLAGALPALIATRIKVIDAIRS